MPKIKLTQDHLDATANTFDEGWFTLEAKELVEKKDGEGADLFVYTCKVTAADTEENQKWVGKTTFINVSEKGYGFAIPMFRAAGANIPDKIPEGGLDIEMAFMVGKKFKGHNSPKPDKKNKNKIYNNWDSFARIAV